MSVRRGESQKNAKKREGGTRKDIMGFLVRYILYLTRSELDGVQCDIFGIIVMCSSMITNRPFHNGIIIDLSHFVSLTFSLSLSLSFSVYIIIYIS